MPVSFHTEQPLFDELLKTLSPPEFKVLCRLLRMAAKQPGAEAEVRQAELEYHTGLCSVTVSKAMRRLVKLGVIRLMKRRPFETFKRYEVLPGSKLQAQDQPQNTATETATLLGPLQISEIERDIILSDIADDRFRPGSMRSVPQSAQSGRSFRKALECWSFEATSKSESAESSSR